MTLMSLICLFTITNIVHFTVLMDGTSSQHHVIGIGMTIQKCILAAHALSGCDTVSHLYRIVKPTAVRVVQKVMSAYWSWPACYNRWKYNIYSTMLGSFVTESILNIRYRNGIKKWELKGRLKSWNSVLYHQLLRHFLNTWNRLILKSVFGNLHLKKIYHNNSRKNLAE